MLQRITSTNFRHNHKFITLIYRFCLTRTESLLRILAVIFIGLLLSSGNAIAGIPNGTWLSKPQIRFYSSNNSLGQLMTDIKNEGYRIVFLDFRGISDQLQQEVSNKAREQGLMPVVWIQSPQYRSLNIAEIIEAARYGDAIQVDDHFFTHYTPQEFQSLYFKYKKFIFCSIQPFQANKIQANGCNQLDVQCYAPKTFQSCLSLAERLNAVVSLSRENTFQYRDELGGRRFNVFLWPYIRR